MWFAFGIFSLISFTMYFSYKKINASWKGNRFRVGKSACKYKIIKHKHKNAGAYIGIKCNEGFDYVLKRETWFDRFCKSIGLVVEHQVGNPLFDDLVFIVSDNVNLHKRLSDSSELTSTILDIFSAVNGYTFYVKKIRHNSGLLWVELVTYSEFEEIDVVNLTPKLVPLLEKFSKEIKSISSCNSSFWKESRTYKSAILLGVSTALAYTGYIQIHREIIFPDSYVIDDDLMFNHSILVGGILLLLLITTAVLLLGRSPRTHLVLIEIILIGGFGSFLTSFTEIRHVNQLLDQSDSVFYKVEVLNKKEFRSRRSSSYYLYTDDWIGSQSKRKIRVNYTTYSDSSIGSELTLTQKSGGLGYRWIAEIKIKNTVSP